MKIVLAAFLVLAAGAAEAAAQDQTMQVCAADAQRLCAASQGAARDACMRTNAATLSAPCRNAMDTRGWSVWGSQGAAEFGGPAGVLTTSGGGQGGQQGGQQGGGNQGGTGGGQQGGGQGGQQGGGGQGGAGGGQQGGN